MVFIGTSNKTKPLKIKLILFISTLVNSYRILKNILKDLLKQDCARYKYYLPNNFILKM